MFRKNWSKAGHGDTSLEDGRQEDQEPKESLEPGLRCMRKHAGTISPDKHSPRNLAL